MPRSRPPCPAEFRQKIKDLISLPVRTVPDGGGITVDGEVFGHRVDLGSGFAFSRVIAWLLGWHEDNNPSGFTVDHADKSQGNGNNHH